MPTVTDGLTELTYGKASLEIRGKKRDARGKRSCMCPKRLDIFINRNTFNFLDIVVIIH